MQQSTQGMPAGEAGIVFFRRGKPSLRTFKLIGRDVVINRMEVLQQFAAYTVPDPAWLCCHIPLTWNGDYYFNGQELKPMDGVFAECRSGYFTRGADRDALTLGFRKAVLAEVLGRLLNQPAQDILLPETVFQPSAEFMKFVGWIVADSCQTETLCTAHCLSLTSEQKLLELMAALLINNLGVGSEISNRKIRSSEIVGQSIEWLSQRRETAPSLSDLCALTGVGATRLFESFQEIQGMSPYKYMRLARLDYAYSRLSNPDDLPASVKQVALELGYSKPGRFAKQFKAQFGQLPSVVLAQSLKRTDQAA